MTDKETIIKLSSPSQNQMRNTQFRTRPVRSSSCTTKINIQLKNSNQKLENKNEKKKVILHVPRKKLKLQRKVDLLSMQQMKLTENDLQFCNNELQVGLFDNMYANQCELDCKATMKNNQKTQYHHNQHLQLKNMLVQLAENHQQMIYMLKKIINQSQKSDSKNDSPPMEEEIQESNKYKKSRDNYMIKLNQNRINRKLKINRVINEVINNAHRDSQMSSTKEKYNNSLFSQDLKKNIRQDKLELLSSQIPSFVANMLVEVLSDPIDLHKNLDAQNNLRELISRRFQAFNYNYNHFLEILISLNCSIVHSNRLNKILQEIPFLLDEDQISLLYRTISPKHVSCESFKVSDLCQKIRYFIQDRTILTKTGIKLRINQMKALLGSKKAEILQAFNRISDENGNISLKGVQKVLKEFRLENLQVQVVLAKLCVISKNVNQIKYSQIFDFNWLDNQAIIF